MKNLLTKENLTIEEEGINLKRWEVYPAVLQMYATSVSVTMQFGKKIFSKKFSREEFEKVFSEVSVEMAQGNGIPEPGYNTQVEIIGNLIFSEYTDQVLHLEDLGNGNMLVYTNKKVYQYHAKKLTPEFTGSYFFARGNKKPKKGEEIHFDIWNGVYWTPWIDEITVESIKMQITENYFVIKLSNGKTLFYYKK